MSSMNRIIRKLKHKVEIFDKSFDDSNLRGLFCDLWKILTKIILDIRTTLEAKHEKEKLFVDCFKHELEAHQDVEDETQNLGDVDSNSFDVSVKIQSRKLIKTFEGN